MAAHSRLHVLQAMQHISVIPVFYHGDFDTAANIVAALARGGATVVEFTHRGDFAQEIFAELIKKFRAEMPQVILGAGSIPEEITAATYINNGANFIVSPNFKRETALFCNRRKVAYMPGCGTATEIGNAEELGVEVCKVFPAAQVGGPSFIKAIKGPMPWSQLMPTGGVENNYESISSWIKAGACCVGMSSSLIRTEVVAKKDWTQLEEDSRKAINFAREAKN